MSKMKKIIEKAYKKRVGFFTSPKIAFVEGFAEGMLYTAKITLDKQSYKELLKSIKKVNNQ